MELDLRLRLAENSMLYLGPWKVHFARISVPNNALARITLTRTAFVDCTDTDRRCVLR